MTHHGGLSSRVARHSHDSHSKKKKKHSCSIKSFACLSKERTFQLCATKALLFHVFLFLCPFPFFGV